MLIVIQIIEIYKQLQAKDKDKDSNKRLEEID
jgi:hypothetical protein